ncbi:MAG TPA: HD domain-containing protein [Chryseolinea sp.]
MQNLNPHGSELLRQVEIYVRDLLSKQLPAIRKFHTIDHTAGVVRACSTLASHYATPEMEMEALLTAAWFHDTGYVRGGANHEQESVKIAFGFLNDFNLPPEFYFKIEGLISATKLSVRPVGLLEEILCDADLSHLGSADYETWSLLLKKESELVTGKSITLEAWNRQNILFFKKHAYYTRYAREYWEPVKQINLTQLLGSR